MTTTLVILLLSLLALLLLSLLAYAAGRAGRRKAQAPERVVPRQRPEGCCGQHETCERESLLAAVSREVEYFDDEELDAFQGRPSDAYRPHEVEQFEEVLTTMREDEVPAWVRSLQLRGISLPDELKDQVLLIVGEMRRFLRDSGMVKVTRRVRELAIIALKKKDQLQSQLNREPTVEEIAAAMGTPKEDVVLAMEAIMEPSSLNDSVYSDGRENICLMDQVQDKISESDWLDEMLLRQAMEALSDREKKILSLRFFAGKTQVEVSRAVGISQAQVSRIEKGALQRIKQQM